MLLYVFFNNTLVDLHTSVLQSCLCPLNFIGPSFDLVISMKCTGK